MQARLASIADQWEFLTQKTTEKSLKLKEANKQRTYIAAVKDLDFWLGEVRKNNRLSIFSLIQNYKDFGLSYNKIKKKENNDCLMKDSRILQLFSFDIG